MMIPAVPRTLASSKMPRRRPRPLLPRVLQGGLLAASPWRSQRWSAWPCEACKGRSSGCFSLEPCFCTENVLPVTMHRKREGAASCWRRDDECRLMFIILRRSETSICVSCVFISPALGQLFPASLGSSLGPPEAIVSRVIFVCDKSVVLDRGSVPQTGFSFQFSRVICTCLSWHAAEGESAWARAPCHALGPPHLPCQLQFST